MLNHELSRSLSEPRRCVELDSRWHAALVANGGNQVAMFMHRQVRDRIARYEYAYWKHVPKSDFSFQELPELLVAQQRVD